jgi:hypothetical protein
VQAGKRPGKEMIIGHRAQSLSDLCSTIKDFRHLVVAMP